jgi:hypothetical protein
MLEHLFESDSPLPSMGTIDCCLVIRTASDRAYECARRASFLYCSIEDWAGRDRHAPWAAETVTQRFVDLGRAHLETILTVAEDPSVRSILGAPRKRKFRGWPGKEYPNAHQAAFEAAHILYCKVRKALCLSEKQRRYVARLFMPDDLSLEDSRRLHKRLTWLTESFQRQHSRVVRAVLTLPNPCKALDATSEEVEREFAKSIRNIGMLAYSRSQLLSSTNSLQAKQRRSKDPSNSFRRVGANWDVCFETERGQFPAASHSALAVVVKLLAKPNHPLDLKELVEEETRQLLERPSSQEDVIDPPGMRDLELRYRELQKDRDSPDLLVREEYEREIKIITAELEKAIGPGGRKRKLGRSTHDRVWDALTKNLRRLCRRLRDQSMPNLAAHLKSSIQIDQPTITYNPPSGMPTWQIEQ